MPDFLFIMVSISFGVAFIRFTRNGTIAGSMLPQRVPIGRPSSGVRPIDVLTHLPPFEQLTEEPLPRWQVMTRTSGSFSRPMRLSASRVTNIWDVPWKP